MSDSQGVRPDRTSPPPPATAVRGLGLRGRLLLMIGVALVPPTLVGLLVNFRITGPPHLLLLLGTLLLGVALAYAVGSSLVSSVEALTDDAHALAAGLTGHRSAVQSSDEIGQLALALNQMAETMERRNAALADNERRYRFLFDSNPLPMWAWDAETTNILAINEAAIEKYGYDRDTFLTLRITDLLDPEELPRFGGARLPFSESRQNAGTWLHRSASGRRMEMEVVTTSSRRLGRASWLSVGIDVTARREAERALARSEDQLRQSQKMEAIGTFAGGISHDFNNLLTGMLGYCDLLLLQLPDESPVRDDVQEIRTLAVRGTELSRQILSVSRRNVVTPVVLDPNSVVRGLDKLLRRVIGENIDLQVRLDPDVGTVRADPAQLEQVLLNLAGNARDAMPSGGQLTIDSAVVSPEDVRRLNLDAQVPWMAIRVRDTGVGMSDEVKAHIFEPFFTTKQAGKGTGLGLALAYRAMDQLGGEIRVDSAVGYGTTMHLLLPRLTEAAAVPDAVPVEPPEQLGGSETVLLTEDEDAVRTVAVAALERRGYRVLAATDGEAALAISRAYPGRIDLLITDVVMPGMSGRDLAASLRRMRPDVPVLFVSGYADDMLPGGEREEGAMFLAKPFTSLDLARRARQAIDTRIVHTAALERTSDGPLLS